MNEYRDILKKADFLEKAQGLHTINAELATWLEIPISYTETHIMCEAIRKIAWMAYESGIEDGRDIVDADYKAAYDEGYEAAASDKKAWYILDKNGNKAHIGDQTTNYNFGEIKALGGIGEGALAFGNYNHMCLLAKTIEVCVPDTRERIEKELAGAIYDVGLTKSEAEELANMYADKLIEIGRDDG